MQESTKTQSTGGLQCGNIFNCGTIPDATKGEMSTGNGTRIIEQRKEDQSSLRSHQSTGANPSSLTRFKNTVVNFTPTCEGIQNFFMTIGKSVASLVAIGSIGLAWVCKPEEMFTNVTRKNVDASLEEYRDSAGAIAWVLLIATGFAVLSFSRCRKTPAPVVSQPDSTKPEANLELKAKLEATEKQLEEAIQWKKYLLITSIKIFSLMIVGMIFLASLIIWNMNTRSRGLLMLDEI